MAIFVSNPKERTAYLRFEKDGKKDTFLIPPRKLNLKLNIAKVSIISYDSFLVVMSEKEFRERLKTKR